MSSYTISHPFLNSRLNINTLANQGSRRRRGSYRGFHSLSKINSRLFWALSLILVLSLSFFYVSQINKTTQASFQVSGYDQKIQKLTKQTKDLEVSFFEGNSLRNLEDLVGELGFEKVAEIHYIQGGEGVIVTK